jgi:hypothetical protein
MPQVQFHRFARQQVRGDRISHERVEDQQVELLRRFAFQRQARIAEDHLDIGARRACRRTTAGSPC